MTQAIAYVELQRPQHASLLRDSVTRSDELINTFQGVTKNELAVEIAVRDDFEPYNDSTLINFR